MTSLYENQLLWDWTIYHTDQARLALFVYRAYYLGIEFYLFVSHEGMKRQRFHV